MRTFWIRLMLTCGVALVTAALTEYLFKRADNADRFTVNAAPLAVLKVAVNEVERRPGARLIWQSVKMGDPLYRGDAIRTSARSEGQVLLIKGGTTIGLEPNSLIVLEESEGKIALDLVNGGLFVKKSANTGTDAAKTDVPIITAGKAKLELGSKAAEVSLSVNDKGQAQVAVTKGNVEVKAEDKKVTLSEGTAGAITSKGVTKEEVIEVLAPEANQTFTVLGNTQAKVDFKWKPLPADTIVRLEVGQDRESLKTTGISVAGNLGTLSAAVGAGTFFWRLVADKKDKPAVTKSIVFRGVVQQLFAPEIVSPRAGDKFLAVESDKYPVSFRWVSKSFNEVRVEVAATADFARPIVSEKVVDKTELTVEIPADAIWQWRVLGLRGEKQAPLASQVGSFKVDKLAKLSPPQPLSPGVDASVSLAALFAEGVVFQWSEPEGVESYKLKIDSRASADAAKKGSKGIHFEQEMASPQFRVKKIPSGWYEWRVQAIGTHGRVSEWSALRAFQVKDIEALAWSDTEGETVFYEEKPQVALRWNRGPEGSTKWRLRFNLEEQGLEKAAWRPLINPQAGITLPKEGAWVFQVQALNAKDNTLAETPQRLIRIMPSPLPAAPLIAAGADGLIRARGDGSVVVRWESVKGARKYIVQLENAQTKKVLQTLESPSTSVSFGDLDPGRYVVRARSVNARAEKGPEGDPRVIDVPAESELKAPKLKKIHVK